MTHRILSLPIAALLLALVACASSTPPAASDATYQTVDDGGGIELESLVEGLDDPWGMDFLPDGSMLVTEKSGAVLHIDPADWGKKAVNGIPDSIEVGQGGMLDVYVHLDADTTWVYLSYAVEEDGKYSTRISRGRWNGDGIDGLEELFTAQPFYSQKRHFGSRILINKGYLFFTIGDRANRDYAQDLGRHNGKVMRLYPDGRVPADNPFVTRSGALPEIWTYGHRNPQGLALHPDGETIWAVEHGPRGGDEVNELEPGKNYGWPIITYGEEYIGGKIGIGTEKAGMEQPLHYYVPSIAACGATFYTGTRYPGWEDSLLIAALRGTHINRLELDAQGVASESRLFGEQQLRFRDVQQGPDGYVYALAGGDRLVKLVPKG